MTLGESRPQPPNNAEADSEYPGSYRYRGYNSNAFHPGRYFRANHSIPQRRWAPGTFGNSLRGAKPTQPESQSQGAAQKPKMVTIVRNGPKPRSNIKILLNKRSLLSYEQLMADISEALWRGDGSVKVQRLFGVNGKEVQSVSDFFRNINLFIALGNGEGDLTNEAVSDILAELYPDGNEAQAFFKEWEKSRKRHKKAAFTAEEDKRAKDNVNRSQRNEPAAVHVHAQDKRDSGFDSSDTATNKSETDHPPPAEHKPAARPRKRFGKEPGKDAAHENNDLSLEQSQNYAAKLEKHKMKLINEERERVNRRVQKIIESERRIREDEKRKKEQVPVKGQVNPFTKTDNNVSVHESADVAPEIGNTHADEEKALLERKQREKEEREAAEKAARHRMAVAERLEREKREKEQQEADRQLNAEKKAPERAEDKMENREADMEEGVSAETAHPTVDVRVIRESDRKEAETLPSKVAAPQVALAHPEQETVLKENLPPLEPAGQENGREHLVTKQQKEKRKQEKEERQQRKRAKTRIVRRTKEERQVSSDELILQRYELGKKLGDGNFAIVRQSKNRETGQEVAIKVIDKAKLKGKEQMVENEIDIMKDCSHQNIVRLYEEYETPERIYLIMELVKGGDLFDAITHSVKFGETDSALMVKDLCNALFYLHSRRIVHRDLKPENLLVHRNKDGTISLKLADFGLAMEVKDLIYTVCGTPTYVAPEILTEIGYGLEVDMWAVGVITYILLCGFPPFRSPDRNQTELFEYIKAGDYQFLSPYWDNTSRSAKDLISRLLIVDRKKRYSSVDVLSHRWIVCNGQPEVAPSGAQSVDQACKEIRKDLESQEKLNLENYQRLKEKKKREREKDRQMIVN
ncbi:Serine/threonine-protein kinase dclk3 [Bulinus truncatus]|nr:Serine/threonine-protein kinase dclk3 [Bulinus truncatus]